MLRSGTSLQSGIALLASRTNQQYMIEKDAAFKLTWVHGPEFCTIGFGQRR